MARAPGPAGEGGGVTARCGDGGQGAAVDAAARAAAACRRRAAKLPRSNAATALVEVLRRARALVPGARRRDWLPAAVYPFALAFEGDALCTFETVVCLLGKWARGWLACWPEPPLPALNAVERLLQNYDAEVAAHLGALGCTPTDWAWPVLRSFLSRRARKTEEFRGLRLKRRVALHAIEPTRSREQRPELRFPRRSECLRKEDWLRLWDHILARPDRPHRLLLAPVAVATAARGPMLAAESVHDVVRLVRSPLACGSAVWPELWALGGGARRTRARASRGPSPTARRRRARRLARGLASIAGAANVANDRFPMPLPRDNSVAAYPKLAYEPRQATDIARAEFRRVAAEHGASRDRRLAENAEARAAEAAEEAAKKLLADQEAAARAEEAALARQQAEDGAAQCINQTVATHLRHGSIMTSTPPTRRQLDGAALWSLTA